jgi:hypothetical protein
VFTHYSGYCCVSHSNSHDGLRKVLEMVVGVTTYSNELARYTQKLCVYVHQDVERPQKIMSCLLLINRLFGQIVVRIILCWKSRGKIVYRGPGQSEKMDTISVSKSS